MELTPRLFLLMDCQTLCGSRFVLVRIWEGGGTFGCCAYLSSEVDVVFFNNLRKIVTELLTHFSGMSEKELFTVWIYYFKL